MALCTAPPAPAPTKAPAARAELLAPKATEKPPDTAPAKVAPTKPLKDPPPLRADVMVMTR